MKVYLEGRGFPLDAKYAPAGLFVRIRKGRAILYFRSLDQAMQKSERVYNIEGNETTVTGQVFPVTIKTEKD